MNVKQIYWVFEKALSDKQCEEILNLFKENKPVLATVAQIPKNTSKEKLSSKELKQLKALINGNG